jgi:tetratricopeptide (TPR) repeat protein
MKNMCNQVEVIPETQKTIEEVLIVPSGQEMLVRIGIESMTIKAMKEGIRRSYYRSIINWLSAYKYKSDATNLEKIKGLTQAICDFNELADWNKSWLIASTQLNTLNQENLFEQLGIWGYYKEVIDILEILIGKISLSVDSYCYLMLGAAIQNQGKREIAMSYFQKSLQCARDSGNQFIEGRVLINIGNVHRLNEDINQAVIFFNESIQITRQTNNRLWEAVALSFMALVTIDIEKAKELYIHSLAISTDIGNLQWQSNTLTNLAGIYQESGDYDQAQKTLNQGLNLAKKTGDRYAEGWACYRLGLLHKELQNYSQAKEFLMRSSALFKEIGSLSEQKQAKKELEYF